jgi:hypothetical protein
VRSCDFVAAKTYDGRTLKPLTVVDEYTREWLAIRVERRITPQEVLMTLADLFLEYGVPERIRSDNGSDFVAKAVRSRLSDFAVTTLFVESGSPWENGHMFSGKLRDELPNGELLRTLKEAQILVERWRREYNHLRPRSSLRYLPPAPETTVFPAFALADYASPSPTGGGPRTTLEEGGPMNGAGHQEGPGCSRALSPPRLLGLCILEDGAVVASSQGDHAGSSRTPRPWKLRAS